MWRKVKKLVGRKGKYDCQGNKWRFNMAMRWNWSLFPLIEEVSTWEKSRRMVNVGIDMQILCHTSKCSFEIR